MHTELTEIWSSGAWVNTYRETNSYDESGKRLVVLSENWSNGAWLIFKQETFTYDLRGNMLVYLWQFFSNNAWREYLRVSYAYDANNNAITGAAEEWRNNQWVNNSTIGLYLSYNNKKDSLSVSGYNCNVQYNQFSDVKDELNNSLVFTLNQNYPNPFNPSTNINFTLPNAEFVTLKIYDILGKEVTTLVNEELNAGNYTKTWDAKNLSSGIYFYKLTAGKFSETKKMILVR